MCTWPALQLHRVQQETSEEVSTSRQQLQQQEQACAEVRSQMERLDVELRLKSEELEALQRESNAKRVEAARLGQAVSAIAECEAEHADAQRSFDTFMGDYNNKSSALKQQIKV